MNVDDLTALEQQVDQFGWDQPAWLFCNEARSGQVVAVEIPGHPPKALANFPPLPPDMSTYELTVIVETWIWQGPDSPWDQDSRMQALTLSYQNGDLTEGQYRHQAEKLANKLMKEMRERGYGLADLPESKEARTLAHIDQGGKILLMQRLRGEEEPSVVDADVSGEVINQLRRIKGVHG